MRFAPRVIAACGITCLTLVGIADVRAQAPADRTVRDEAVGCSQQQEFLDLMKLNPDEFAKVMVRKSAAGECTMFLKGETVTIDREDPAGALYCLRRRGDVRCYWTRNIMN